MSYFDHKRDAMRTTWRWPDGNVRQEPILAEPKLSMEARGEPEEGHALYVQLIAKQGFCQLCMSADNGPHFQGFKRKQAARQLKHLRDEVEKCVKEMRGKVSLGSGEVPGLRTVWLHVVLRRIQAGPANPTKGLFWHSLVKPMWQMWSATKLPC